MSKMANLSKHLGWSHYYCLIPEVCNQILETDYLGVLICILHSRFNSAKTDSTTQWIAWQFTSYLLMFGVLFFSHK